MQNAAGEAIFGTGENVLLTASTASGKTEAAFFPILTLLDEDPPHSVGVLYIAPLKALINDQFGRLTELCEEAGIPVTRWHGDVPQTQKRRLLRKPRGILQITPESLESLLINKRMEIPSLFGDLRFVVIDEIHSLLRGDRGMQTFCLIERLSKAAGCHPRRVGLSATIGDPQAAGRFLAAGSGRATVIPQCEGGREVWRLSMEHFFNTDPRPTRASLSSRRSPSWRSPPTPPQGGGPGHWLHLRAHPGQEVPHLLQLPGGVRGRLPKPAPVLRSKPRARTCFSSTTGTSPPPTRRAPRRR